MNKKMHWWMVGAVLVSLVSAVAHAETGVGENRTSSCPAISQASNDDVQAPVGSASGGSTRTTSEDAGR